MNKKIPASYFQNEDTLKISQELLGKFLVSNSGNQLCSGMIVETEAYLGKEDRASHAFGGRRTKRTETMYLSGGHWYIYLCYGIHSLINVVTRGMDEPHGILIRAIEPCEGIDLMLKRRKKSKVTYSLTSGPGSVAMALGITTKQSGEEIGKTAWIEDRGVIIKPDEIIASPRVGIEYAKEHALLPYRFKIRNNPWTTK